MITERLLSERKLAEKYSISRFSVRKALAKLKAIGVIQSKAGSGYFVNIALMSNPLIYNSITENKFGEISYKKIKLNKRLPTTQEMQIFSINSDEYLWHIRRLILVQGKVIQIEETKLPVSLFTHISNEIIESSLQKYALHLGLEIDSYLTTYRAINLSKEDAQLLNCKRSHAAMNITNRVFLKTGKYLWSVNSLILTINAHITPHSIPKVCIIEIVLATNLWPYYPLRCMDRAIWQSALSPLVRSIFNWKILCCTLVHFNTNTSNFWCIQITIFRFYCIREYLQSI